MKIDKKRPFRILGIDPGTNVLGYAVLEVAGKQLTPLEMGVLTLQKLPNHYEKLKTIFQRTTYLIQTHKVHHMAIEAPFFGKNVQSMLKLGRAQGVAMAAGAVMDLDIEEYSPKRIKQAITGNGNASKEQVARTLEMIYKISFEEHYLDASDALAAAVCHYQELSSPIKKVKGKKGWADFLSNNPNRVVK
jgi:crossover junction endodeoxyribonuclease RuvC